MVGPAVSAPGKCLRLRGRWMSWYDGSRPMCSRSKRGDSRHSAAKEDFESDDRTGPRPSPSCNRPPRWSESAADNGLIRVVEGEAAPGAENGRYGQPARGS